MKDEKHNNNDNEKKKKKKKTANLKENRGQNMLSLFNQYMYTHIAIGIGIRETNRQEKCVVRL